MRKSIFKKAEKLKDLVVLDGEIEIERGEEIIKKSYFTFKEIADPPLITLANNGKYTYLESCTCTSCSIHLGTASLEGKHPLCSYQIAIMKYLGRNK